MKWIAEQSYYKVERVVTANSQEAIVQERHMRLYEHKLETRFREFPIRELFDLSYRQMGGEGGLLYLHTKQGVFSYTVHDDPAAFIDACRAIIRRYSGE
ncbi:hypothetical protein [Paenibacillus arenilitoris]|uniref:Uncharacterized protein n=1 Tax=Paenibacillus arenilitoris TaxID=2772299 RepID=A0A927CTW5_9BACL|nr:hypothetical protein [Paenibacillus arenilitoris]MBD2871781.1 hypothetical protein [Paenibacillus arenilitoris]